jgi:sulfur transfer protein SufE
MLIDISEGYKLVPPDIAVPPYPEDRKVPACESDAHVWAIDQDGSIQYYFSVGNPQGVSAKATAAIIDRTCSGAPLEQIVAIPNDIIYEFFGEELSVAKNLGLTNMLAMCKHEARTRLEARAT